MRRLASIVLLALIAVAVAGILPACGTKELVPGSSNIDLAKDEATKVNIISLQTGIDGYIATNQAAPPTADAATLGALVNPWPKNAWTGLPMKVGAEKGDYTYQNLGGVSYKITGHLAKADYTRP